MTTERIAGKRNLLIRSIESTTSMCLSSYSSIKYINLPFHHPTFIYYRLLKTAVLHTREKVQRCNS
jgi:hypothetical protein